MLEPECVTLYDSKIYNNSKDTPAHNLSELLSTLTPCQRGERDCHHVLSPPSTAQLRWSPAVLATELRSQNRVSRPGSSELRDVVIQEGAEYLEWSSLEVTCWIRGQISGISFRALFWPFFSLENILFPCFMAEIKSHGNLEWPLALGGWSLLGAREVGLCG